MLSDLVVALSKLSLVEHKMAALARVMKSSPECSACEGSGHVKTQCHQTAGRCAHSRVVWANKVPCHRCGNFGHIAKFFKLRYFSGGRQAQGNWKRNAKGRVKTQNTPTAITSPASAAKLSICDRYTGATRGSVGIDIPVADTVTILTRGICKVPLDAYGSIGQGLSAFLMGRSSSTIQGINVHLCLIDSDYVGQIQAMVSVSEPPVVLLNLLLL